MVILIGCISLFVGLIVGLVIGLFMGFATVHRLEM